MRVELRAVGKSFGAVPALQGIDLDLPAGSRTALVGPNGSGKSTLVRLLMGMLAGDGEIRLDGLDPSRHRADLAPRIAYVPQIAPRLWAPVGEVVAAAARLRGIPTSSIAAVAARLDLDLDLAALGRRPFRALSGGMRQKVLAATALAAGAQLLLLDEPTASMDPQSRLAFHRLLDELPGQPTVVLCSHRVEELRRQVDQVVVLADGRVSWHGAAAAWLAGRAEAMVEVVATGERAAAWLGDRGFRQSRSGWWTCTVPAARRLPLLRDMVDALDGTVTDVLARDLERIDDTGPDRENPA